MTVQDFLKVADITDICIVWANDTKNWYSVYSQDKKAKEVTVCHIDAETWETEETEVDASKIEILKIKVVDPNDSVLLLVKDI